MATTRAKLMTADELFQMEDDDRRYDLIEGVLYEMSPTSGVHGEASTTIGHYLFSYVREHRLGMVYGAETGFRLAHDPDTVLGPDVAFVRAARMPPRSQRKRFMPLAPDLAVEIISPSDRRRDVLKKVGKYLDAGVAIVWVVDPERLTVTEYRQGDAERVFRRDADDTLDGGDVVPGFRLSLSQIFLTDDDYEYVEAEDATDEP